MTSPSRIRVTRLALVCAAVAATAALTACGTGSSSAAGPSAVPPAASTARASSAPVATSAPVTTAATPAPIATAATTATARGQGLAGFAATSVTFVSAEEAFVLGTTACAHAPCTAIAATPNRGGKWRELPAPAVPLGDPFANSGQAAVWGIRFADPEYGFVFGNGLWVTSDGGEQWTAIATPGGSIVDLEVIDGQVLALSYPCSAQSGCGQQGTLYRRALSGGPWSAVTPVSGARVIATQAQVAAVLDLSRVVVTGDGGLTFAVRATPCAGSGSAGSAVAVTGPDSLDLLCAGGAAMGSVQKTVYVSDDLGATWTKAGSPPLAGDPWGISAGTPAQLTVAALSGATWLYYSADGGVRWSTAYRAPVDGGVEFNDLGFTTTADGVAVFGPVYDDGNPDGMPGQLLLTSDGGASWTTVRF